MRATLYLPEHTEEVAPEGARFHVRFESDPGGEDAGGFDGFDGPLELLLRTVRGGRPDLLRLEISSITRQFLETLEVLEILDLRVGSEFLKVATALLRLKARRLLPAPQPPDTPESDPELALAARLADYARYREAAQQLRRSLEARNAVWVRAPAFTEKVAGAEAGDAEHPPAELLAVDLFAVVEAFRRVMARARARPEVALPKPRISMETVIERIEAAVPPGSGQDFEELLYEILEGRVSRSALVAAFLAVLELARRRRITIGQEANFGPIRIVGLAPS